jgi:hypothetical protein
LAKINLTKNQIEEEFLKKTMLSRPNKTYMCRLLYAKYVSSQLELNPGPGQKNYDMKKFIEAPLKLKTVFFEDRKKIALESKRIILSNYYGIEYSSASRLLLIKIDFVERYFRLTEYYPSYEDYILRFIRAMDTLFYLCIDHSTLTNNNYIIDPAYLVKEYQLIKNNIHRIIPHTNKNIAKEYLSRLIITSMIFLPMYITIIRYLKK